MRLLGRDIFENHHGIQLFFLPNRERGEGGGGGAAQVSSPKNERCLRRSACDCPSRLGRVVLSTFFLFSFCGVSDHCSSGGLGGAELLARLGVGGSPTRSV